MPRPPFCPTPEHRHNVKTMAGFGIPHEGIARVMGISGKTLRKNSREELDRGAVEADTQVINTLYRMAISGEFPAATIFWVKSRCRWRERPIEQSAAVPPPEFHIHLDEGAE